MPDGPLVDEAGVDVVVVEVFSLLDVLVELEVPLNQPLRCFAATTEFESMDDVSLAKSRFSVLWTEGVVGVDGATGCCSLSWPSTASISTSSASRIHFLLLVYLPQPSSFLPSCHLLS